ncbi:MAG: hypothetical protein R2712_03250 [Vicinamibacterales bacterium]
MIVPIDFRGRRLKAVITAGKPAVIEALNAATGEFLFALDPGAQNIFTFDPETGRKTLLPPGPPEGTRRCPSNDGARNYLAGAYDPASNRYYLSVNDICTGKGGDTPDRLLGLDLGRREFTLDVRSGVLQSSAKLTTAGGLLFSASADRYFRAYDTRDGSVLWQTRVQDIPSAFPITYAVDGQQYVAMVVGNPGLIGNGAVTPHRSMRGRNRRRCSGSGSCRSGAAFAWHTTGRWFTAAQSPSAPWCRRRGASGRGHQRPTPQRAVVSDRERVVANGEDRPDTCDLRCGGRELETSRQCRPQLPPVIAPPAQRAILEQREHVPAGDAGADGHDLRHARHACRRPDGTTVR